MDDNRFDDLTRTLAARLPRRALGGLVAAVLGTFSLDESEAADRPNGKRKTAQRQRASRNGQRDGKSDAQDRDRRDREPGKPSGPLNAEGKKKKKAACVPDGGSCKKPKKGKAKKCCAGLACDASSQKCTCPANEKLCRGQCIRDDVCCGGCGRGQECSGGECLGDPECDEDGLVECLTPFAAELGTAYASCDGACGNPESAGCGRCIEGALAPFNDLLAACAVDHCADRPADLRAEAVGDDIGVPPAGTCSHRAMVACNIAAGAAASSPFVAIHSLVLSCGGAPPCIAGIIAAAQTAAAAAFLNCWAQFGCETGYCNAGDVCCRLWGSHSCGSKGKMKCCPPGGICAQGTCRAPCPNGRQKCGSICCAVGEICKNGGCQLPECSRGRGQMRGEGDECCIPLTCAEMNKSCGRWGDGCGDMVDCGACYTAERPGAQCDYSTGQCACYPDNACLVGTCGAMNDGCGGTKQCGSCATAAKPRAFCGADNQCQCAPYTCAELGKSCGAWPDGCGGTVDCGSSGRKTCAELGKECGSWDDGCNGTVDCGGCATETRPKAYCNNTGACVCQWDGWCRGGCGPEPDGCGGTVNCGRCDSPSSPNAYCGEDRQCHCEPETCADGGKTCGYHPTGCGGSADCGNHDRVCGRSRDICCAEGQTCCGLDWSESACCDWSACHKWPGGKPKGCCPDMQQCLNKGGNETCCPDGWRCRGGDDPSHPTENCCVMSGQGDAVLNLDESYCCSGKVHGTEHHGWICD